MHKSWVPTQEWTKEVKLTFETFIDLQDIVYANNFQIEKYERTGLFFTCIVVFNSKQFANEILDYDLHENVKQLGYGIWNGYTVLFLLF